MPTYTKRGLELSVNTAAAWTQHFSQVATFADGGFIVVWETSDTAGDGSGGAVKAQRFDSAGSKIGGEFLVNSSTATTQSKAAVTTFADGSFAIAWMTDDPSQDGNGRSIKARLFSASGAAGPEFLVNTATAGNQGDPSIVTLANGNFVVSWWEAYFGEVHARIFTSDGTALGADFRVNTNVEGSQNSTDISALAGGGFVVTWRTAYTGDDGSGEAVKGQVFSPTGAKVGGEFLVNSSKAGHQNDPAVAALAGGGFVVTWVTNSPDDGSGTAIKAQLFGASGTKIGSEFLVNSMGLSGQEQPTVTSLPDGGFMVAWTTLDSAQDGIGSALKAQVFDSSGARVGSEILVNTQSSGNQSLADIATLSDGRVVITWTDANAEGNANSGIKAQILGAGDPPPPPPPPNWAPVITSDGGMATAQHVVSENEWTAAHVTAQDPDGQAVTYSIIGGADAALFTISAQTGVVSFISRPDYEAPGDSNGNNSYEIVVSASDGSLADTQTLSIRVADVDENVAFTSSNNVFRPENYMAAYMITAVQPQDPSATITYRLVEGGDADRFVLNATTGALTFVSSPNYEAPADLNGDNSYIIMVEATDGLTTAVDLIRIHIGDVDEAPVITSGGGGDTFALSIGENQSAVTTVSAFDPENPTPNYAIVGGADADRFTIDARTGALSFVAAPDFEARGDSDRNNIYAVTVSASDLSRSDSQTIFVTITNENEPIAFVSGGGGDRAAVTVSENSGNVLTLLAVDPEGTAPQYGIAGGADAALFELDPATKTLRFKALPDFETPGDSDGDNVYEVVVGATDGQSFDYQTVSVTVGNVYEGVRFAASSSAFSVEEGTAPIGAVSARGEAGAAIVYAIAGGADASLFSIDPATGALGWAAEPDHEKPTDSDGDNVYDIVVSATDGTASASHAVSVTVQDVFEPVEIVSYAGADTVSLSVDEGYWMVGAVVEAVDQEGSGTFDRVVYSITGGADAALFTVDPYGGALDFTYDGWPDFENPGDADGDNVYEVVVTASTSTSSDSQAFAIAIANSNEGIFITSNGGDISAEVSINEGQRDVTIVAADDPDGTPVTYSIVGGPDASRFTIDAVTGALSLIDAPDYEAPTDSWADNVYQVVVSASDGELSDEQTVHVSIDNVDEPVEILSYGGAATVALTMAENIFEVSVVEARDRDSGPVTFSISGADEDSFEIDPDTGALSFRWPNAPDFEDPASVDSDNVYDVLVTASSSTSSATQAFQVTIVNANEAPYLYDTSFSVNEGVKELITFGPYDRDGDALAYEIVGGPDSGLFRLDPATGLLEFIDAPDYEAPLSAAGTNVYTVDLEVSDGVFSSQATYQVTIKNVNEGVTITSGGGAETLAVTVAENGTAVTAIAASDMDGDVPTYWITGGADADRFIIDSSTGVLRFIKAPNFEAPGDVGGDNVYDVVVWATDGVLTDSQAIAVTVANLNEPVSITSNGGGGSAAVAVAENGTAVTVVTAIDPDGGALSYAIVGGADAARFTIDSTTGALAFVAAPDFEGAGDNVYGVIVSASDGSSADTQSLTVTVGNVDEPVEILSYGGAAVVAVNLMEDEFFTGVVVQAADEENMPVTYSISGGADGHQFEIDPLTGALSFMQPNAADFEDPRDSDSDNVHEVIVTASTSTSTATQTFMISITNRNEAPALYPQPNLSVNEGQRAVTVMDAYDRDGDVLTYRIVGGADAALFMLDPATGVLSFVEARDYEAPASAAGTNVYSLEIEASDGEYASRQSFQVAVRNVNEGLAITSGGGADTLAVTALENFTSVTSIFATDLDGDVLTYSISGGADSSRFTIDARTGALRFVQAPNFEAPADSGGDNVYDVVVSASDGSFTDSQAIAVTVTNVNETVAITSNGGGASASVAVAENGAAVATVAASDPDGGTVTYAIAGGADSARFRIDPATGALAFVSAPNFEAPADSGANNVYDVVVSASDGSSTDTQAIAVTVTNVNEALVITSNGGGASASVAVAENGATVAKVAAFDPDGGAVTYAIAGGADSARFTIDSATGVLAFVAAPNFEAPGDAGGDNVYDIVVSASDGSFTDTQAIAVTVGNVNEAPSITSSGSGSGGAASVAENSLAVVVVTATDPDGTAVGYSIVGGADAARFTINAQTGALQFVAAPDWELPADSNQDNVYSVVVRASDGQIVDEQALNVTVTNIRDGNTVTGTSGGDSISATSLNVALRTSDEEDVVFGREGHDTIQGMAGEDEIYGEGGNDTLVGGAGADRLSGGLGKDQFTYNAVSDSTGASKDLIVDFSRSQGDKISLSAIDANSLVISNQAFTFIGTSAFSNVAGQLRYETAAGVTNIFGDVNGDGVADLQIQLSGSIALIASDFIL